MKKKQVTIKLDPAEFAGRIPAKDKKVIDKALKNEIKDIHAHFKRDGWDLDYDYYRTQILVDLLGYDPTGYILATLAKQANIVVDDAKTLLLRRRK